ncbi:MAG TPA: hypothetical protein VFX30_01920 [bacterium]|nr:hypothetical protein [bacterium]
MALSTLPPGLAASIPPGVTPTAFHPQGPVLCVSDFAMRGMFVLQNASSLPAERLREALIVNISDVRTLNGFGALPTETQDLLASLHGDDALSFEDLSRAFRVIGGSPFAATAGHDVLGELIRFTGSGAPPADLFAPREISAAASLMPGGLADWNQRAGSVLGHAGKLVGNAFVRKTGLGEERPEQERHYGVERLTDSAFAVLPLPESLEEGEALYREAQAAEIAATEAYRNEQMARMTEPEKEAFLKAEQKTVDVYRRERGVLSALLEKVRQAGGYPDTARLNKAKRRLDQAVARTGSLRKAKIGPREFQILSKRHLAETWGGKERDRKFLIEQALGQERDYVLETLLIEVTQRMRAGRPPSEWTPYEKLAAEAIEVYGRVMKGTETRATDEADLARIRSFAFPFAVNWEAEDLPPVRDAMEEHETARREFAERSHEFVAAVGGAATAVVDEAERVAMERAKIDFEFQKLRLRQQYLRLQAYLKSKGHEIAAEHQAHFEAAEKAYEESFNDYMKFWGPYSRGEDVKAREHARNQKDKETLFNLAFRSQWALEELYEIYEKQHGLEGLRTDGRARPSCVSFSYNNSLRTMDEAIRNDAITSDNIEAYFSAVWALAPEAFREIGITIPRTGVTIGGRKIPSNAVLDQLATVAGTFFSGDAVGRTVYLGLEDKAYLLTQIPAHPEVGMVAGADAVYEGSFLSQTNLSQQAVLQTANHSGILEFLMMIELGILGIHAPQLAQGGVAEVPVFGDYVKSRAVVVERSDGSAGANQKIIDFLLREQPLLTYPAGTRLVSAAGGHPFAPDQVLGWRIVTDRYTSGQIPKIALELKERFGETGQDFLISTIVQNGSAILPEPTWFLGKELVEMILGNLSPKSNVNLQRSSKERQIAFGPMLSSLGFLTEEEWKRAEPSLFIHGDRIPYSDREGYVRTLQLNANVISALQRLVAAGMDLASVPEPTEAQKRRKAELLDLSPEERRALTEEPMDRHLRERSQALGTGTTPLPEKPGSREPLPALNETEKARLNAALPADQADRLIDGLVPTDKDRSKAAYAGLMMREAAQRGASYAKKYGDRLALDGDKVLWDHFFTVDPSELPEMLKSELVDQLSVPEGSSARVSETINLNPQWVAFILGFRKAAGCAPVLFSSTMSPRLHEMAKHVDRNPLVRAFFESLLGETGLTSQRAIRRLAREESAPDSRIITRQKIADYVVSMMARFRAADFNLAAFSEIERQDILTILKTDGDVHLKYRGLFAYDALVDDRDGNVAHANAYNGRNGNGGQVLALQPETWTSNKARLYLTSNAETDVRQRLNEGRSGQALAVIRRLEGSDRRDGLVRFDRRRRPQRIKGLIDRPISIQLARNMIREHYEEPQDTARAAVTHIKGDIAAAAATRRDRHSDAKIELARILEAQDTFTSQGGVTTIPPARLRNALKLLRSADRGRDDIKGDTDFEILEWLIRRIPEGERRDRAVSLVGLLKDRGTLDLWAQITPRDSGATKRGMKAAGIAGKILTRDAPQVALAVGQSLQHIIGEAMKDEIIVLDGKSVRWGNLWKYFTSREQRLLVKLGRFLQNGEPKLSAREQAEAYGIVAERLGTKLAKRALERAFTDEVLAPETRRQLQADREVIEKRIDDVGRILKKTIKDVWTMIDAAMQVYGDLKELGQASRDLASGAVADGIEEFVRGRLHSLWQEIRSRREVHGMNTPALPNASVATQIADNLLSDAIRLAGGEQSEIGWLLFQARLTLHERGLDESIRRLMDLPTHFSVFRKGGDAKKIAGLLRRQDASSLQAAERILTASLELMLARNPASAENDFQKMFAAAWRHSSEQDRPILEAMARKIYLAAFPKSLPAAANGG